ncbi:MAG: response regulator [Proteobacteria bacterium]|nr:response regulator [Pseudomonadota bacterium]MBU4354152.1 response regulator [Pseudomonadota bacterium]MBU4448824.1 response regulator [Pseudomonadota bacterium]
MQPTRTDNLRGYFAVIIIGTALVAFVAFLLISNYFSQIELQKVTLEQLKSDTEKRAAAVSYFVLERENDLRNLAEKRELSMFFENKALEMSMEYGLRDSLLGIAKVFERFIADRKLGVDVIYNRIALVESSGEVLVDRSREASPGLRERELRRFLDPGYREPKVIVDQEGSQQRIIISLAYFFKGRYAGQIVAWISSKSLYNNLVKGTGGASRRFTTIVDQSGRPLFLRAEPQEEAAFSGLPPFPDTAAEEVHWYAPVRKDGARVEKIAMRSPIQDTPFFLVTVSPASEVFGHTSPGYLLLVMGILSLALLGGMAVVVRRDLIKKRELVKEIAERQRADEALRESEKRLANIIDFLPDATLVIDREGKVIAWNKAIEEMTGIKAEDMLGKGNYEYALPFYGERRPILIDLVHKPQKEIEKYAEVKREGLTLSGVAYFPALRGKEAYLFGKASILLDSQENIIGAIETIRDVTEHQKAEAERLRFSKLESLGTLAGGIAHDFNNILTAILGNIGLAMLEGKTEGRGLERLTKAEEACLRAHGLAQQLLTFAKGGAPIKKLASMAKLLRDSAELVLAGSKTRCDFSLPEDLWGVDVDEGQIDQAISNLLINADQALAEGGTIKVAAHNVLWEEGSDLPLPTGKYVKVTIADQGIGIPFKYLHKIFDPYFTTKHKGSGLGLATAYSIIKNHSGYLKVESEVGEGTTFYLYLPALDGRISPQEEETAKPVTGRGRILVMDDEEMVREVLGKMLTRLGYEAEMAKDGEEAIQTFATAKESGRPFDMAILDLTVPGGMGGKEAAAILLKIYPQIKAIVSSGYSDDPIMADFKKYGFSNVIAKPYRILKLSEILNGN